MSVSAVERIMDYRWLTLRKFGELDPQEASLLELVEDSNSPDPELQTMQALAKKRLRQIIKTLDPETANILKCRCGFANNDPATPGQLARILHLGSHRIAQIEASGLNQLRDKYGAELEDFRDLELSSRELDSKGRHLS